MDISNLLHSSGVGLESQAHNVFGAAVDDFIAQGIDLARNRIVPEPPEIPFSGTWTSSRYASDISFSHYAPKHRFMFRVTFEFAAPYSTYIGRGVRDSSNMFNYLIKQIDKPTIVFKYEPVNFYNYRTSVITGIEHQQISMAFYDDVGNNVFEFFDAYRKAYSPISRIDPNLSFPTPDPKDLQNKGMDFSDPGNYNAWHSAAIGSLTNEKINVLTRMTVYQIFGHGQFVNQFIFINPRILQFDFDDLDFEGGNGNILTVQIEYDALATTTVNLAGMQSIPGLPNGLPHEIRPTMSRAPGAGGGILGSVVDRAVRGLINVGTRNLGVSASQATQKVLGPGSGYIGYSVGSVISDTSRYTLHSASRGVNQPYAGVSQPPLNDPFVYPQTSRMY
jgi:hypothetical protein